MAKKEKKKYMEKWSQITVDKKNISTKTGYL